MDPDELAAWLRLLGTPTVGRESARKLLLAFGSPEAVFSASVSSRCQVVPSRVAKALDTPPDNLRQMIEATCTWLQSASDTSPRSVITLGHRQYPAALLDSVDPPLLLYAQGQLQWLSAPAVGVVGSRNATAQGLKNAGSFSQHLSQVGLTVISGLARGIDGAAHEGALPYSGRTIAVVGTGLDRVYPRSHQSLAHRISEVGLLVSEYAPGTPPLASHFPQRNRIIAGLSRGVLVIEAAVQSGSLISARLALENNREVFAIPGSIHSPHSRGCHALIKQGAKLVETANDIMDELRWGSAAWPSPPRAPRQAPETCPDPSLSVDAVLTALSFEPVNLDTLMARTGWGASTLSAHLLDLELRGCVARLPGQIFQRVVPA